MAHDLEIMLRRSNVLEHLRWSWDRITAAIREAEADQGPYAIFAAYLFDGGQWRMSP
jgi:hypothetical protein